MRPHKIPALENNLYTSSPRGAYCLCSLSERSRPCRRSAGDLFDGEICLSAFSFPELQPPVSERNAPRSNFSNSCRTPRVGAIGPNNYHTWNEVFIVGQRSFAPRTEDPRHPDSFRRVSSFFWRTRRRNREMRKFDHDFDDVLGSMLLLPWIERGIRFNSYENVLSFGHHLLVILWK